MAWLGQVPTQCQICGGPLKGAFVDGVTRGGRWAIKCLDCHRDERQGLGTGRGQMYDVKTKEKIDG
jgi:hypothetical protein